jgi:hypothetical protein
MALRDADLADSREATILRRAARATRETVLALHGGRDSCILTACSLARLLRRDGWRAEPLAVAVLAFNTPFGVAAAEALRRGKPLPRHGTVPGAWSVGIGHGLDPRLARPGWDGHLVVLVAGRATRYLLDAALDQASRPERAIVAGLVLAEVDGDFLAGRTPLTLDLTQGHAQYEARREDRSYRTSPDYLDVAGRQERVIAAARRRAATPPAGLMGPIKQERRA